MAFLDDAGLVKLWQNIQARLSNKIDKVAGKSLVADSEISRLASVKTGLEISDTDEELEEGVYLTNADQLGGIAADNYALKANVVTSVNGQTGDVVITEGGGSIDTSNFYSTSNPPPYPVTSVNGSTGAVTLNAGTGISVSGTTISNNGVTSVGGKTGAVTLSGGTGISISGTTISNNGVTSIGGKTGTVTLNAGTGISVSETTISNSGVTSVNGRTGAITIPAIKYADLNFTFSGMELASYATLPSDLTDINQIINILSFNKQVFITKPQIYNGTLYVAAHGVDIGGEGNTLYPYYLDYYVEAFTARVFYF